MLVKLSDGCCFLCKGQLKIIDVDDATMQTECTSCGDENVVETDAFSDGGIVYWPICMAKKLEARRVPRRKQQ